MAGRAKKVFIGLGIGCVGIPILLALVIGATFLIGSQVYKDEPPPHRETTRFAVPTSGEEDGEPYDPGPVTPGRDLPDLDTMPALSATPLRLKISLEEGEFEIVPGPPGSAVKAEGFFDPKDYELIHEVKEGGDLGPEVTIRFRRIRSILAMFFRDMDPEENKVKITVPRGVPTALDLNVRKGESHMELGGVALTDLRLNMSMGDHNLDFSEPNPLKIPNAVLRASMGDMDMRGLGNARAERITVHASMGDMKVDFGGQWPRNFVTTAMVKFKMGDARLSMPDGVRLSESSSSNVMIGEGRMSAFQDDQPEDPEAPTLNLNVSMMMGEVRVYRNSGGTSAEPSRRGEPPPSVPTPPEPPEAPKVESKAD